LLFRLHSLIASVSFALTLLWASGTASLCCGQEPKKDSAGITVPKKAYVPFLKKHCLRCHNEEETRTLDRARIFLADGGSDVPIRRLNKREYINTMYHLFGLNLNDYSIPEDIRGEHFDTLGESQFFDIAAFDKYLELGTDIAREGLRWSAQNYEKSRTTRIDPEKKYHSKLKGIKGYLDQPRTDEGQYILSANRRARGFDLKLGPDPRASYRIRILAGLVKDPHPLRRSMVVNESSGVLGVSGTTFGTLRVRGTVDDPKIEEIIVPKRTLALGPKTAIVINESKPSVSLRGFKQYQKQIGDKSKYGTIWVDWIEVEGPLYPSRQNFFGSLFGKGSRGELKNLKKVNVREVIEKFGLAKSGESDVDALAETLGIVLASPSFLYLEEESTGGSEKLTARSLATRLAYFLWSSPPDEELYRLANSRKILQPETLKKQVVRMLEDPKAKSFYEGYMSQWAELDRLNGISVNLEDYPGYNAGFQHSIGREAIEFFKVLVQKNLPVDNLIDSDFVVVNAFLADHYELPEGDYSNEFEQVKITKKTPRGGLITQAGFLTMGSDGNRTSPVIRGALLMDKLLNTPPPPPPPNVPELAAASDVPVSNRRIAELHQKQTACASCHKRIDPIGFGLENYDVLGQWRDFENVGKKKLPIKAGATLVSGVKFSNLDELKKLLLTQRRNLAKEMVESLLSYGLGRNSSFSDQDAIDEILKQSKASNYQMRDLIIGIVNSKPFQSK